MIICGFSSDLTLLLIFRQSTVAHWYRSHGSGAVASVQRVGAASCCLVVVIVCVAGGVARKWSLGSASRRGWAECQEREACTICYTRRL